MNKSFIGSGGGEREIHIHKLDMALIGVSMLPFNSKNDHSPKQIVLTRRSHTRYGSQFDAGRRSSK